MNSKKSTYIPRDVANFQQDIAHFGFLDVLDSLDIEDNLIKKIEYAVQAAGMVGH